MTISSKCLYESNLVLAKLNVTVPQRKLDTLTQIIWNNRFVKVGKLSVLYENWHCAGVEKLSRVLDENKCKFLTFSGFQRKFKLNCKFLRYYGLLSTIPKYWKDMIKLPNSQEFTASTIDVDGLSCKTVSSLFISRKHAPPTSDSRLIACGFDSNKRRLKYSLPFRVRKKLN